VRCQSAGCPNAIDDDGDLFCRAHMDALFTQHTVVSPAALMGMTVELPGASHLLELPHGLGEGSAAHATPLTPPSDDDVSGPTQTEVQGSERFRG